MLQGGGLNRAFGVEDCQASGNFICAETSHHASQAIKASSKCVVIVAEGIHTHLLREIHDLPEVHSVVVFTGTKFLEQTRTWAQKFTKIGQDRVTAGFKQVGDLVRKEVQEILSDNVEEGMAEVEKVSPENSARQ